MLFFVKGTFKMTYPVPPVQLMEIVVSHWQMTDELIKQGKILAGGQFLDGLSGCFIFECASTEEISQLVASTPLYHFCQWEVASMNSSEFVFESYKQALKRLQESN